MNNEGKETEEEIEIGFVDCTPVIECPRCSARIYGDSVNDCKTAFAKHVCA